jgi:hypothetical protein
MNAPHLPEHIKSPLEVHAPKGKRDRRQPVCSFPRIRHFISPAFSVTSRLAAPAPLAFDGIVKPRRSQFCQYSTRATTQTYTLPGANGPKSKSCT